MSDYLLFFLYILLMFSVVYTVGTLDLFIILCFNCQEDKMRPRSITKNKNKSSLPGSGGGTRL